MKSDFGSRMKKLRAEKGLTLDELVEELHISKPSLSRYENNKAYPKADDLAKIADYYNVTTDYLLGRTDERFGQIARPSELEKDLQKLLQKHDIKYIEVVDFAKSKKVTPEEIKEMINMIAKYKE